MRELAAFFRRNGPPPIMRADYHTALIATLMHNSQLDSKHRHQMKKLTDFMLWKNEEQDVASQFVRAMAELGIAPKQAKTDG